MDVFLVCALAVLYQMIIIFRSKTREPPQLDALDHFAILCVAFLWPIGALGFLVLWSLSWPRVKKAPATEDSVAERS
jgi:hypothetical protein